MPEDGIELAAPSYLESWDSWDSWALFGGADSCVSSLFDVGCCPQFKAQWTLNFHPGFRKWLGFSLHCSTLLLSTDEHLRSGVRWEDLLKWGAKM